MELDIEILKKLSKKSNNSKVKFRGDYKKSIDEVLLLLEEKVLSDIGKLYKIKYTAIGTNYLKLKIEDETHKIDKLIECILRHTYAEEQYGYAIVDIVVHEYSKRQKGNILGKYDVIKKEILADIILKKLIELIEEI